MRYPLPLLAAVAFCALALVSPAGASQQGTLAMKRWKTMDNCAQQAQEAFPDFTAEANAKRDARLRDCLAGQNLPPRAPLAPSH